jgi:uncharacterized RDD family membrane protein YckC
LDNKEQNNNIDTNSLELATTRTRTTAFIIDDLLITLVAVIMLWDQISASGGEFINILTIMNQAFIQIIFMKVIYQTYFIWYYGATIGKTIMKLKVIDFNHLGRVTFIQALIRSMGRIISESFFYIGFLMAFYTESRQTLHDKFGKTLVVNA